MNDPRELKAIEGELASEAQLALQELTAWARVGRVQVVPPTGRPVPSGVIERKTVPLSPGGSPRAVIDAWARTIEGKIADHMVERANTTLLTRLPQASAKVSPKGPWMHLMPPGPIVLLGHASELAVVMRLSRGHPEAFRLRPCPTDTATGLVSAVGPAEMSPKLLDATGVACTCAVTISIAPTLNALMIVSALEVRSKGLGNLVPVNLQWE